MRRDTAHVGNTAIDTPQLDYSPVVRLSWARRMRGIGRCDSSAQRAFNAAAHGASQQPGRPAIHGTRRPG